MTSPAFSFSREDIHNLIRQTSIVVWPPLSAVSYQLVNGNTDLRLILAAFFVGVILNILSEYGRWPTVDEVKNTAMVLDALVPQSKPVVDFMAPIIEDAISSKNTVNSDGSISTVTQ